jgi:cysteinyl-tRNA synthetase
MLMGHYRQQLNFTFDGLHAARHALERLSKLHRVLRDTAGTNAGKPLRYKQVAGKRSLTSEDGGSGLGPFQPAWGALLDDLNTPEALGRLFKAAKELEKRAQAGALSARAAAEALTALEYLTLAFGWELPDPLQEASADVPAEIREMAENRLAAKKEKDFATADRLRDAIQQQGWAVRDRPDGYELIQA